MGQGCEYDCYLCDYLFCERNGGLRLCCRNCHAPLSALCEKVLRLLQ